MAGVLVAAVMTVGRDTAQAGALDVKVPGLADISVGGGGSYVELFSTELTPLTRYDKPHGCTNLPPAAHVLLNHTTQLVTAYVGPSCLGIPYPVLPGYGFHVAPVGASFQTAAIATTRKSRSKRHRVAKR